jgi:AcrR family transcriptional regulator
VGGGRQRKAAGRLTASARRTQLVEIARTVFAKRGYEATSVEEIAARAKVSKPILYEHFGGKEGLYAVLVDREMDFVVTRIAAAISEGTPRQRVERAALAFLTYVRDHRDGFLVLSRDAPVRLAHGGMSSLLNDVAERVADVFVATFKRAGYDAKTAPIYAHALVGMVTFVGQWWIETQKPSVEEVASHIAALAWMGLRHLPKRPKLELVEKGSKP